MEASVVASATDATTSSTRLSAVASDGSTVAVCGADYAPAFLRRRRCTMRIALRGELSGCLRSLSQSASTSSRLTWTCSATPLPTSG
jgi:hypothetical protein